MALAALTAFDSTVWRSLGDGPFSALAAQEKDGPLSQAWLAGGSNSWMVDPILFYSIGLPLSIVL
jgi:hypothetical protein